MRELRRVWLRWLRDCGTLRRGRGEARSGEGVVGRVAGKEEMVRGEHEAVVARRSSAKIEWPDD